MSRYGAYGLVAESALPLPELLPVDGAADVVIRVGAVSEAIGASPRHEIVHRVPGVASYAVRHGREITVCTDAGAHPDAVRWPLLGSAFGALLYQRGHLVLHGSAVEMGDGAVGFLGDHGAGKSTAAAALVGRGHRLVADDLLCVDTTGARLRIEPAFPQLKLCPDVARRVFPDRHELARIDPDSEKLGCPVPASFCRDPVPLSRLYLLDLGEEVDTEPLAAQLAVREVLRHWYGWRFATNVLRDGGWIPHFRACVRLVTAVPMRRLRRPTCLSRIDRFIHLVEQEAGYAH